MSLLNRLKKARATRWALAGCLALAMTGSVSAQETAETKALKDRLDRLEKQNEMLMEELQKQKGIILATPTSSSAAALAPADDVKKIVQDELKAADEAKKQKEAEEKAAKVAAGHEVGSDRKLNATWENDGIHFKSEHKDFDIHIGGRINTDFVWWKQPSFLKGAAPGSAGIPGSAKGAGIGTLDDGAYLRRIRLRTEGTLYENLEFFMETDFENLSRVTMDEAYVGIKNVPFLGVVRIGHHKVPQGLESYSSSRYLETLERSALFDTFEQEFGTGIFVGNSFLNDRATWAAMFHRIEVFQPFNDASFGDGNSAFTARVSALPIFDESGRCYVHTAASYQYRSGNLGRTFGDAGISTFGASQNVVRFRDRAEIRDATGAGADGQGDGSRLIDTGYLSTSGITTVGTELLAVSGPVYLQAESIVAQVEHGRQVNSAAAAKLDHGSPTFWGYYGQVGYFLTGESRPYQKNNGTYGRVVPNSNFFLVRGHDGNGGGSSLGALELVYRFSYDDLNSNRIVGGTVAEHTAGINWYWSPNMRMQFNYTNANRNSVGTLANAGTVQGVAVRSIIDF